MTAKKPRKIDERWAQRTFEKLLNAREPETSQAEIDKMAPSLYKHRIGMAAKEATKALQERKQGWERQILLALVKVYRPDCTKPETYGEDILHRLVQEVAFSARQAYDREKSLSDLHANDAVELSQAGRRIQELENLIVDLQVTLKLEQQANDVLRAELASSEVLSVGANGGVVSTVRSYIREQLWDRFSEVMGKEAR